MCGMNVRWHEMYRDESDEIGNHRGGFSHYCVFGRGDDDGYFDHVRQSISVYYGSVLTRGNVFVFD